MPLHLPPLSRRDFIKRAGLTGAAFALAPNAFGGLFGKSRDKNSWALLSDTHVNADATMVSREVDMADHLTAVGREVIALPKFPAGVFINGDLAFKSGTSGDYATFAGLIEPMRRSGLPIHLSLGNHDDREHFWSAFPTEAKAQHPVPNRNASIVASSRANWFLLDSLEATDGTPGLLGESQLAWLEKSLTANVRKPAIILVHHNLQHAGWAAGLKDSPAMQEMFARHRQIKAFIFGHTHNWLVEQHPSGVHLINLPPVGYVFSADRPSGWVLATVEADALQLQLRCLDAKHPEHGQPHHLKWRV